ESSEGTLSFGQEPRQDRRRRWTMAATTAVVVVALVTGAIVVLARPFSSAKACKPTDHPEWSVARRWDEALLDAIRRALPNPPVHARNLFHLSVAMWDAWATYDTTAVGYISKKKVSAANVAQARDEAISYAAWAVLKARYQNANGAEDSLAEFDSVL